MHKLVILLALAGASCAAPLEREVTYQSGGATLEGFLALSDKPGKHPGVLVVHEWWGHNDYARKRARMLADLGYNALAVDMYGDGRSTTHPEDATAFMTEAMSNLGSMSARFQAAYDTLRTQESTDPDRIAAIGYCFGGAVVLHMARTGMDLDGVASFHGVLAANAVAERGGIKAAILVCHGEEDQMVTQDQARAFRQEMRDASADLQFVTYPDAQHGFTNPAATALGEEHGLPIGYDAKADEQSWQALEAFLAKVFEDS